MQACLEILALKKPRAKIVDEEVSLFVDNALKKTKEVLEKHRPILDAIANQLIEKEIIEKDNYDDRCTGLLKLKKKILEGKD